MVLGSLSFSLMAVCVKQVGARLPVAELVLARAVVSLVLSGWMLHRAGVEPWGHRRGLLLARGVLGTVALGCVYGALVRLPLATATVLQYLYPPLTALLAVPLLGERIGRTLLLALPLGWVGVALVVQAGTSETGGQSSAGVLLALAGALLTALAYVSVRDLGRSEHPLVIVFWFPLVAGAMSLPLVALDPVMPTARELPWLLGVGVFTQLGQLGLTRGLTGLPAARASALGYSQVVFAALWGALLFGEGIRGAGVAGAGLILVAALLSRSARPAGEGDR